MDDIGPVVRDGQVAGVEADAAVGSRGGAGRGAPERRAVFEVVGRSDHDGEGSLTLIRRCTRYAEGSVPEVADLSLPAVPGGCVGAVARVRVGPNGVGFQSKRLVEVSGRSGITAGQAVVFH
nr:hypothetical protein [Streptomyces microflavus]